MCVCECVCVCVCVCVSVCVCVCVCVIRLFVVLVQLGARSILSVIEGRWGSIDLLDPLSPAANLFLHPPVSRG